MPTFLFILFSLTRILAYVIILLAIHIISWIFFQVREKPTKNSEISPEDIVETDKLDQKLDDICISLFQTTSDQKSMEKGIKTSLKQLQSDKKSKKIDIQVSSKVKLGRQVSGSSVSHTSWSKNANRSVNRNTNSAPGRGRRHVPVHMSAPFATNLERSAPRAQTTMGSAFKNRFRKNSANSRRIEKTEQKNIEENISSKNSTLKKVSPSAAIESSILDSDQQTCNKTIVSPENRTNEGGEQGSYKGEVTVAENEKDNTNEIDGKKKPFSLFRDG